MSKNPVPFFEVVQVAGVVIDLGKLREDIERARSEGRTYVQVNIVAESPDNAKVFRQGGVVEEYAHQAS